MKLYYSPALAPWRRTSSCAKQVTSSTWRKSISRTRRRGWRRFLEHQPKGYVPALQLDDGQVLTEVGVICQYLADQKPESGLAPKFGTMERYRLMEAVNFTATEIHKQIGALFNPMMTPEMKEVQRGTIERRFNALEKSLAGKQYSTGNKFSVADAYLFSVLSWTICTRSIWPSGPTSKASWPQPPAGGAETMKAEGLHN
jgi:glutathione S-transferase